MEFGTPGLATLGSHGGDRLAALLLREHGAGRRGDRAVDAPAGRRRLAAQLPLERAELSGRRAPWPRWPPPRRRTAGRVARAAGRAALSHLPQHRDGRGAAARGAGGDAARDGRAAGDDRGARARHRSQGGLHPRAHSFDPAVRGDAGRSGRPVGPRRAGGPHRGARCTTSATWRCPNTSCRSPMR